MSWSLALGADGVWKSVQQSGCAGVPYSYATKEEAENMLGICYPDQVREARLFGSPKVRVLEVRDDTYEKDEFGCVEAVPVDDH